MGKKDNTKQKSILAGQLSKQKLKDPEQLKVAAYYIWEQKGKPNDSSVDDWLEAERSSR